MTPKFILTKMLDLHSLVNAGFQSVSNCFISRVDTWVIKPIKDLRESPNKTGLEIDVVALVIIFTLFMKV